MTDVMTSRPLDFKFSIHVHPGEDSYKFNFSNMFLLHAFFFDASLFHYPTVVARICCLLPNTISVKLRVTHRP